MADVSEKYWKVIFFLLPVLYFAVFGTFGLNDTDGGFLAGLSWRLLNGQHMYQDFEYVRPPLSPLFHAGIMKLLPMYWEIPGERLLFYVMMAAASYACASVISSMFRISEWGAGKWSLSVIGFIFNTHYFPPMPWHTTDGIFFAACGAWFLIFSRDKGYAFLIPGVMLLTFAALCKQSFYPLPVLGVLLVFIRNGRLPGVASLLIAMVTFFLFIQISGTDMSAMYELFRAGEPGEVLSTGFRAYLKGFAVMGIPALLAWIATGQNEWSSQRRKAVALCLWAIPLMLSCYTLVRSFSKDEFLAPAGGYSQGLFAAGLLFPVLYAANHFRESAALLFLMSIGWCAGISWGYPTPMLFILPSVASLLALTARMIRGPVPVNALRAGTLVFGIIFFLSSFRTYRDDVLWNCTYPIGKVYPQAGYILTGRRNFEKHEELRRLNDTYGDSIVVFPGFPHADYLTQQTPRFATDWEHNGEIAWNRDSTKLITRLRSDIRYVFVENGKEAEIRSASRYGSRITLRVIEQWVRIHEGDHFTVYQNPAMQ